MQYLYKDGDFWTFMNPENYEQLQAGEAAVGDAAKWLKDGIVCIITLWNGVPLVVTPPPHIDLKVVETDPGLKGDTATGGQKVAKLETGASVRVPLFINEGEVLRIDTRTRRVRLARQGLVASDSRTLASVRRPACRPFPLWSAAPERIDENPARALSRPRASAAPKRAMLGLSRSSTPSSSPPRNSGITIFGVRSRVAGDVAGKRVHVFDDHGLAARRRRAANALAEGDTHAGGLALEGPQHQFATLI